MNKTLLLVTVLALTGCATHQQANTAVGAMSGAAIGHAVGGSAGAVAGAIIGSAIGGDQPTYRSTPPVVYQAPPVVYRAPPPPVVVLPQVTRHRQVVLQNTGVYCTPGLAAFYNERVDKHGRLYYVFDSCR